MQAGLMARAGMLTLQAQTLAQTGVPFLWKQILSTQSTRTPRKRLSNG
jgi:hypothetical protein